MKYHSTSVSQTKEIARDLARKLKAGDVVAFFGVLGAGKTTFIQSVAKELGIKRRLVSPTFVLAREYNLGNKEPTSLWHLDLYRIKAVNELRSINLKEIINNKDIILIEWADRAANYLPRNRTNVFLEITGENKREIKINKEGKDKQDETIH